jgi:hypothetical protein
VLCLPGFKGAGDFTLNTHGRAQSILTVPIAGTVQYNIYAVSVLILRGLCAFFWRDVDVKQTTDPSESGRSDGLPVFTLQSSSGCCGGSERSSKDPGSKKLQMHVFTHTVARTVT